MKRCPACEQTKPTSAFAKHLQRGDGLQPYCRACRKKIDEAAYQKKRAAQVARNRATKTRNKKKMLEYLLEHPCVDCGIANPLILDRFSDQCRGRPACLTRWVCANPSQGRHTGLPLPYTQLKTDLTFDHVKGEKRGDVARLTNSSLSWNTILAEIEKCVVRCFNCHMIKTAKEKDWNRVKYLEELREEAKRPIA